MNRIKIRQGLPLLVAAGADADFAQVGLQSWGIAKRLKISEHIDNMILCHILFCDIFSRLAMPLWRGHALRGSSRSSERQTHTRIFKFP